MVDYWEPTGYSGRVIIRDDGEWVSFWVRCDDSSTWFGSSSWSGTVNGVPVSGSWSWSQGGGTRQVSPAWRVSTSQTVTFRIAATGTSGLGGPTTVSQAITRAVPGAPSNLVVTRVSDRQHSLVWQRNGTYTSSVIQRRTNNGAWQQVGAPAGSANSFTDTSTVADRRYDYRVAVRNAAGQSGWSNVQTVYTTPSVPVGVGAVRAGLNIVVDASQVSAWADSFDVRDGSTVVGSAVALPFTHTSPSASVPHTYTVRARRGSLVSDWSAVSNTVQLLAPPGPPTNLTPNGGTVADGSITFFQWRHAPVDASPQTAFELRFRPDGGAWTTRSGSTVEGLGETLPVGFFTWQVRTRGEHPDWSPWSAVATVSVVSVPGVAVVQPSGSWDSSTLEAQWSWFQAEGRPQSAWEAQLVQNAGVVETRSGSGNKSSVTFSTRLTEGDWMVRVRAATGSIWSPWGEEAFTVVFDPPAPPTIDAEWDEAQGGVWIQAASGDPLTPIAPVVNRIKNPQSRVESRSATWGTGGAGTVTTVGEGENLTFAQTWTTAPTAGIRKTDIIYGSGAYVVPVTPNEAISFELDVARASGGEARLTIAWDTSAGSYISQVNSTPVAVSADWENPTVLTVSGVAPANAGRVRLSVDTVGPLEAGDTLYSRRPRMNGQPYFDGSMSIVYIDGVARRPQWDGPVNASTTSAVDFPVTVSLSVERSVDNGESWEPVAESPSAMTLMDWESPVFGTILYRATAVTAEGAVESTTVVVQATSNAVWLSAGDGFEQAARLPYDPQPSITGGRDRVTKQYAGRSLPVTFTGEAKSRRVTVKGRTTDRQEMTVAVDRLIDVIQDDAPLHLYRDPDRRRIYGMVTDVTVDRDGATVHEDGWNGIWGYSFVLTEATSE